MPLDPRVGRLYYVLAMKNEKTNWLADLVPGSKVIISGHYRSVKTVSRITKTLIVLSDGSKFRRRDGWEPGDGWHKRSITPWTEAEAAEIAAEWTRAKNLARIKETRWRDLSAETISEICRILAALT